MKTQINDNLVSIEEVSLYAFLEDVQQAVIEGFRISTENDHMPQGFVGYYACKMVKEESAQFVPEFVPETEAQPESETQEATEAPRTRRKVQK